jgi:hypothetical protein
VQSLDEAALVVSYVYLRDHIVHERLKKKEQIDRVKSA